jgi:Amt family ammonium transporter
MPSSLTQSVNLLWVLLSAFLVMFMQVGFAMVETGLTRSKNAVNTMAMTFLVYPLGVLGFWLVGFGVMMGGVGGWPTLGAMFPNVHEVELTLWGHPFGLFGASRFALMGVSHSPANLGMFFFSVVFMVTSATIPTGTLAERWRFSAFALYSVFVSMLLYPLYGNWVWGGGWLADLGVTFGLGHGHVDFAGATVVHMTGGVIALAGAMVLGPRADKFRPDGTIATIPGHNLPMAIVGTLVLAFGWFGFNTGSTLSATDPQIANVAVNTMLSSSAGAFTALVYVWQLQRKLDPAMVCNGLLGGLAAITGSCPFVSPATAVLIGLVAGILVPWSAGVLERRYRIDDPVGAIAVHGVCGAWGALAVGLFADGTYGADWNGVAGNVRGILFGDPKQLLAQTVGIVANVAFVFPAAFFFFRFVGRVFGNRVSRETEAVGLDSTEMGVEAYPPA